MTGYAQRDAYRELLVSPVSMRASLLDMILREISLHRQQGGGEIIFKCNQLVDREIVRALYRASMAGVRVRLQVRGICCLRPGVPGISENITVTSVVGRFLEHSRLYWFHAGGEGCLYIGSADLMPRNLDRRLEVAAPVHCPALRQNLRDIFDIQWADNVKARILDGTGVNKYSKGESAAPCRSQTVLHEYYSHMAARPAANAPDARNETIRAKKSRSPAAKNRKPARTAPATTRDETAGAMAET